MSTPGDRFLAALPLAFARSGTPERRRRDDGVVFKVVGWKRRRNGQRRQRRKLHRRRFKNVSTSVIYAPTKYASVFVLRFVGERCNLSSSHLTLMDSTWEVAVRVRVTNVLTQLASLAWEN